MMVMVKAVLRDGICRAGGRGGLVWDIATYAERLRGCLTLGVSDAGR